MSDKYLFIGNQSGQPSGLQQVWKFDGDTPAVLADAANAAYSGQGRYGISISNDGMYVASAGSGDPSVLLYKRSGDTFTPLSIPAISSGADFGCAWSPTGTYLATWGYTGAYLRLFKRTGDTLAELAHDIAPPYRVVDFCWITDTLFAYSINTLGACLGKRNTGSDTFYQATETLPSNGTDGCFLAASSDGVYLAAAPTSGNISSTQIWKRSGSAFSLTGAFAGSPNYGNPTDLAFSTKGEYAMVGLGSTVCVFKRTGDTFNFVSTVGSAGAYTAARCAFSGDTLHAAIGSTNGGVGLFKRTGDSFTALGTLAAQGSGSLTRAVAFWPSPERDTLFRQISGHVFDANGTPVSRRVNIHHRESGNLVSSVVSDPVTGSYYSDAYLDHEHYIVVLDDTKNAQVFDHITPATP